MAQYPIFIPVFVFIIGACIGSFLNVVIFRLPAKASIISPGSHCPACKKSIPFYLNIPVVSYLLLRGKCRFCKIPISIRYPAIEALTGIAALMVFQKFGISQVSVFWFIFSSALIVISFIDLDHQIIHDVISIPGIFIFATAAFFLPEMSLISSLSGILTGGGILYGVALAYYLLKGHQGMGGGDIKLLAMIGAATGIKGVLFTLFTGSLLGTFVGVLSIILGKMGRQMRIPFGPFLSAGAFIYLLWGENIIRWYINIIGRT
ncbi:MAG: prepilin peptidase [Desulfobacter sp.]|nr:prepilin peptidase [Desulfobacter sp.]WDP85936.1 MAG: prepilin peptidase [Desulfobacter sp.]